jgi:hypothetical protein
MQVVPVGHRGGGKGVKPPQKGYCLLGGWEVVALTWPDCVERETLMVMKVGKIGMKGWGSKVVVEEAVEELLVNVLVEKVEEDLLVEVAVEEDEGRAEEEIEDVLVERPTKEVGGFIVRVLGARTEEVPLRVKVVPGAGEGRVIGGFGPGGEIADGRLIGGITGPREGGKRDGKEQIPKQNLVSLQDGLLGTQVRPKGQGKMI